MKRALEEYQNADPGKGEAATAAHEQARRHLPGTSPFFDGRQGMTVGLGHVPDRARPFFCSNRNSK